MSGRLFQNKWPLISIITLLTMAVDEFVMEILQKSRSVLVTIATKTNGNKNDPPIEPDFRGIFFGCFGRLFFSIGK